MTMKDLSQIDSSTNIEKVIQKIQDSAVSAIEKSEYMDEKLLKIVLNHIIVYAPDEDVVECVISDIERLAEERIRHDVPN